MKTKEFSFNIPEHLIAQEPCNERGQSRLLLVNRANGTINHALVSDLPSILASNTCMVFNDSKVRNSRVFGQGHGGGKVEVLFTALSGKKDGFEWLCMLKKSGSKQVGTIIKLPDNHQIEILERRDSAFLVRSERVLDQKFFDLYGHIPLPPYIHRPDNLADKERYQTIYAKNIGSSAAPTAGLHFSDSLLSEIDQRNIQRHFLSLHVGLGTFAPVQCEEIQAHQMHQEEYHIPVNTAKAVTNAKQNNQPILAVGTTSLRTLEAAWQDNHLSSGTNSTQIFIYPGYQFKVVDQLFTNFHTSESTLFMLVCAFAGTELMKSAYQAAITAEYRFFSYGDAMLIQ